MHELPLMRRHLFVLHACAAWLLALPSVAGSGENTAELEIVVTNIETMGGELVVALFATEASFASREDPIAFAWLEIAGPVVRWSTVLEAPMDYAVAVYHDRNGNRELDTNRLGRPREPYGFSNDARGVFGPPDFDEAAFRLEAGGGSISIRLE